MENKKNVTAIILCGGLGTRLRTITNDLLPKPMVKVAGRPFLEYLLDYLISQGVNKVVLAVSHHKEFIIEHFSSHYRSLNITYSIEQQPLGTGGAIKHAIQHCVDIHSEFILVLNGDTFVEYKLEDMMAKITNDNTNLVIATKTLENTDRYGRMTVNKNNLILAFEEKKSGEFGKINAGVYLLYTNIIDSLPQIARFSFESDYLEKKVNKKQFLASQVNGYFIDIGIKEDYYQANHYFKHQL